MAKKNILKRILPLLALAAASAAIGMTGATVLHNLSLENPIKTPPVEGQINEELKGHIKNTYFENTGDADVFLRVAYAETWTTGDGSRTLPIMAQTTEGSKVRAAKPQWNPAEQDNWVEREGWLYYKYVLKAGEAVDLNGDGRTVDEARELGIATYPIVTSVVFSDEDELSTLVEKEAYKNGRYDLHFVMEVVQASDEAQVSKDAIAEVWGDGLLMDDRLPGEDPVNNTWDKSGVSGDKPDASGAINWNGSEWVQDPRPTMVRE